MNVDSAHLQVLIIFQGIDGSYDAVQLSRIATVVGMKLYLVDREVDISTFIEMTNLDCLYGRTYEDSQRLTAMAEMEIISLLQVATSTKIFMHIEIVVLHDSRHRNGSGILKGLCLLVVTANHHRLWRKVQMFVPYPTFIHNLLAFSVDDNLRQLIFQLLTLEDRSIYQLGIGRKVKRIEVEIHRYRQSVILLRHLHIANLNLVGSQLYFMTVLCHNSCRSHQ